MEHEVDCGDETEEHQPPMSTNLARPRYHSGRVVEDVKFASLQTSMANLQPLILNLTSDLEVRKAVVHFLSSN